MRAQFHPLFFLMVEVSNLSFHQKELDKGTPCLHSSSFLCMEYLGQLIEGICSQKLWSPVKTLQGGLAFSHLMFTDDVVLFSKANHGNYVAIRDALNTFCSRIGQTISEAKSWVFFFPNVDRDSRESLCDVLGFALTPNIGKYLRNPIKHQGSPMDVNFILDRVKQKLVGWKANLLSLASCTYLIQASSSLIPAHVMQCALLPNKILKGIDLVNRNFLWGLSETTGKIH